MPVKTARDKKVDATTINAEDIFETVLSNVLRYADKIISVNTVRRYPTLNNNIVAGVIILTE
jgi:hypothetical protein